MERTSFTIKRAACLAPMAGFADGSFRRLCRAEGAAWCTSEMVSAKAIRMGDRRTPPLMAFTEAERPFGIQLFGNDPGDIAFAARFAEQNFAPDFIDINMGCPAPKIAGGGAGSRLMTKPQLAAEIVCAAVQAVRVPVTVKLRAGYDEVSAPALAPLLEQSGAAALTVHGRTRAQMYRPPVNLDVIRDVKRAVRIPVIGNGDIASPQDALEMLGQTGCDAVMVGRAALGDPFLFRRLSAVLAGLPEPPPASLAERLDALLRQTADAVSEKGEFVALREIRKHAPCYLKGLRGAAKLRVACGKLETMRDLEALCAAVIKNAMEET